MKGFTLGGVGNYTEAIEYFDKALAIDPHYELALYNKGVTLDSLGKYIQLYNPVTRRYKYKWLTHIPGPSTQIFTFYFFNKPFICFLFLTQL